MYVLETYSAVNREIVNSLLALLYKCVAEQFPRKFLGMPLDFLHSLIHRYGAYRHRTVAYYPLTCFVDVCSCRQVHQRVASPLTAPYSFFHFLLYA